QHAWITKLQSSKTELQEFRRKSKRLLYSIMPRHIAHMLQEGIQPNSICESHKLITIMFAYSMDFKEVIQKLDPTEIVECMNQMVNVFDKCTEKFNVFKVETKADASYMIVAGFQDRPMNHHRRNSQASVATTINSATADDIALNAKNPLNLNQAEVIAGLALDLLKHSRKIINPITKAPFRVKFGLHSGGAVGGIVGNKNFQYCLFGDTVNTASRVTTTGDVGKIHVSDTSHDLLKSSQYFELAFRGRTEMKGKEVMTTYWLTGAKPAYLNQVEALSELSETNESSAATVFQQTMYQLSALPDAKKEETQENSLEENTTNSDNKNATGEQQSPARRLSKNVLNTLASSTLSDQCPFSGMKT
ncbi:unnamed protein product, partial [Didymodactylos carnosus]